MSLNFCLEMKIDTGGKDKYIFNIFETSITHNLHSMAKEAGLYQALWRPEKNNFIFAKDIITELSLLKPSN